MGDYLTALLITELEIVSVIYMNPFNSWHVDCNQKAMRQRLSQEGIEKKNPFELCKAVPTFKQKRKMCHRVKKTHKKNGIG